MWGRYERNKNKIRTVVVRIGGKITAKKIFFIDFEGFVKIEAESHEEAEKIFWENLRSPLTEEITLDYKYETEGIEED